MLPPRREQGVAPCAARDSCACCMPRRSRWRLPARVARHTAHPHWQPTQATQAGAELMGAAYHASWQLPVITTRLCNVFGPGQFVEKLGEGHRSVEKLPAGRLPCRSLACRAAALTIRSLFVPFLPRLLCMQCPSTLCWPAASRRCPCTAAAPPCAATSMSAMLWTRSMPSCTRWVGAAFLPASKGRGRCGRDSSTAQRAAAGSRASTILPPLPLLLPPPLQGAVGETYAIGPGRERSVRDVAADVCACFGLDVSSQLASAADRSFQDRRWVRPARCPSLCPHACFFHVPPLAPAVCSPSHTPPSPA